MSGKHVTVPGSPEISDDDDSFNMCVLSPEKPTDIICISSDEETTAQVTSDEEYVCVEQQPTKKRHGNMQKCSTFEKRLKNSQPRANTAMPGPSTSATNCVDKRSPLKNLSNTIDSPSETKAPGTVLPVAGVEVAFPMKPYGCQVALMFKVITGIKKRQNCLLESPTGSGKTLALLCSALAWQRQENSLLTQQLMAEQSEFFDMSDTCGTSADGSPVSASPSILFNKTEFGTKSIYDEGPKENNIAAQTEFGMKRQEPDCSDSSSERCQVTIHKRRRVIHSSPSEGSASPAQPATPEKKLTGDAPETPKSVSVPTIYYGARTHKQLQQVIKEFARTAYCGESRMSLLSSREHSCIRHFDKSVYKTKNDMCRECVPKKTDGRRKPDEPTKCVYFDNKQNLGYDQLPAAFDLEDLVQAGEDHKACPYYAARTMAQMAHIVFCPYNYLIDPSIRNSLSIDLTDEIVILDEAHNIEDICRDSATFTFTVEQIRDALQELETITQYKYANQEIMTDVTYLVRALSNWNEWFRNQMTFVSTKLLKNGEATHTWNIEFFTETLQHHNIGKDRYLDFSRSADKFCKQLREDPSRLYGVSQATGTLVAGLATMLVYLFDDNCKHMEDFRPVLMRNVREVWEPSTGGNWRDSRGSTTEKEVISLRLLSMSPAVVFSTLSKARCVLLSSGTLAPIVSLYSELGADFPLKVSPNHVVPPDRVWVGTLSTCPDGSQLECTARGTARDATLDALGKTVRWVASVTPHGVLCFIPSYYLMNKLIARWQETGLWAELGKIKNIFQENRNVKDHNDVMEEYYEHVGTQKGAILFAVYRGKVSEGMDFKDHQARAVITFGIPYPNTFDMAIREKMAYNDKHSRTRNLLASSEWLRVQAYRALNQAVGRCVRHRGDWGAVLMCDARFAQPTNYYVEHLSHWLRNFLGSNHHTFESLVNRPDSLKSFMQNMTIRDQEDD